MSYTEVLIYNQACSAVTTTSTIGAVDEASVEAEECTLWYETVRDTILGAAMWGSTTKTARLALLSERDQDVSWEIGDPMAGFAYAYARPADMLRPRYLTTYAQFTLGLRSDVPALMTNQYQALLVYTMRQTNPEYWDSDLREAIVHGLASKIARKLTGSRSKMLDNFNQANELILQARANAANQLQRTLNFAPSAMIARGAGNLGPETPYIYPSADWSPSGFGNVG